MNYANWFQYFSEQRSTSVAPFLRENRFDFEKVKSVQNCTSRLMQATINNCKLKQSIRTDCNCLLLQVRTTYFMQCSELQLSRYNTVIYSKLVLTACYCDYLVVKEVIATNCKQLKIKVVSVCETGFLSEFELSGGQIWITIRWSKGNPLT